MDFKPTNDQAAALKMVERLMDDPAPCHVGVITGYAGTGKTSMIKAIESLYGTPIVLAPTGKASLRVNEATGIYAQTLHQYIYRPRADSESGEVKFVLREAQEVRRPDNGLVIVDEASMVGREMWEDLWSICQMLDLKVLLVGDNFQLAPVEKKRDDDADSFIPLTMLNTPHRAHLAEVTRQALDSPILRASMMLRTTSRISEPMRLLKQVYSSDFDATCRRMFEEGGVVICYKNETRARINATVRRQLGYEREIQAGEPLLVLRNNYGVNKFNGEVVPFKRWVAFDRTSHAVVDRFRSTSKMLQFGVAEIDTSDEVMLVPEQIHGETADMGDHVVEKASRRYYRDWYSPDGEEDTNPDGTPRGPPHLHANFGYALTAHKSQGSEWKQGLVFIEKSIRPTSVEGRRWVYTAITRFKDTCFFTMET